jgi:hypothetical protein
MTSLRVLSAAGAILALGSLAGPVSAAPLGAAAVEARTVADGSSTVTDVHYRRHRGYYGYAPYYGYRWSPPVYSYDYYSYKPYYSYYYSYPRYRSYYGDWGYRSYKPHYGYYGYRRWY